MARRKARPLPMETVILTLQQTACHLCGRRLRVVYHNHRTVVTLKGLRRLVSIMRRCPDPTCDAHCQVVGPEEAGRWALPGSEVGLDVIAQIGSWRYHEHRSIPQMHQLLEERGVEIAQRTVTNALYRYDE